MAESSDDQYLLNCPICLHLLRSPVATSCGHSFCKACLNECWDQCDQKGVYSCPQCRQTFSPRPALSKNTVLDAVVEKMKTQAPEEEIASPAPSVAVSGDVDCDICTETKLKAIKSCLVCLASYCESHIQTHYKSPALKWHKLVNASPHLLDQTCSQHHKPLELYCVQDHQLICMQCALINHQNHNMTSSAAAREKIQVQLKGQQDNLQKKVHQREKKVQELSHAVNYHKSSAEAAVKHCEKLFDDLIRSMAERQAETTKMIRAQEKAEVTAVEEITMKLEQEISDLKKSHEELVQLSQIEDDIYVIQNFDSLACYQFSNVSNISISQHLTFEEIETDVSELKSQLEDLCDQDIVWISEKVPIVQVMVNDKKYLPSQPKTRKEFLIYYSHLNLNSSSACKGLYLYENTVSKSHYVYRSVNAKYQVLCKEKLSGRCYFELEWAGTGTECFIAFSYDQISLGGDFIFGCNDRSWKCDFPTATFCVQHNNQQLNTSLVKTVGVFLEQAAGTVSFYSVSDKMTLLHRMQTTFTEPVYLGFSFLNCQNASLLRICDLRKVKV